MDSKALIILALCCFGLCAASTNKSENCQKAAAFIDTAVAEYVKSSPVIVARFKSFYAIDLQDTAAMKKLACDIVDSQNLHDLYASLPRSLMGRSYEMFVGRYNFIKREIVIRFGGYTNLKRNLGVKLDSIEFGQQHNHKKPEWADLLTQFFKTMQVKYGSRWLSLLLDVDYQNLVIEDPSAFVKILLESKSPEETELAVGLDLAAMNKLEDFLLGKKKISVQNWPNKKHILIGIEAIVLLGDMGLLNL